MRWGNGEKVAALSPTFVSQNRARKESHDQGYDGQDQCRRQANRDKASHPAGMLPGIGSTQTGPRADAGSKRHVRVLFRAQGDIGVATGRIGGMDDRWGTSMVSTAGLIHHEAPGWIPVWLHNRLKLLRLCAVRCGLYANQASGNGRGGTGAECTMEVVVRPSGVKRSRIGSRSSIDRR
jgi:hypothetical protein